MSRCKWKLVLLSFGVIGCIIWTTPDNLAKPPRGGGDTATGTIYYAGVDAYSINADGSNPVQLPNDVFGDPSLQLHSGQRWFLRAYVIHNPDGTQDRHLVAIRDKGDGTSLTVPLITDPSLHVSTVSGAWRWTNDGNGPDTAVSFAAEQYDADGTDLGRGVFRASVRFDQNDEPYLTTEPALVISGTGDYHHWSPDGNAMLFDFEEMVFLYDVPSDEVTFVASAPSLADLPQWSPDGTRIAFFWLDRQNELSQIHVVDVSFDQTTQSYTIANERTVASYRFGLARGKDIVSAPYWGPASGHLVYVVESASGGSFSYSLTRIRDDGSQSRTLASDDFLMMVIDGWR